MWPRGLGGLDGLRGVGFSIARGFKHIQGGLGRDPGLCSKCRVDRIPSFYAPIAFLLAVSARA